MLRTQVIRALQAYLQAQNTGPVTIVAQEDDADLTPPYAVVRIGSAEDIGAGQVQLWDFNVFIAVFHDAEVTTIDTAEIDASGIFATLAAPEAVMAHLAASGMVPSCWHPLTTESGITETRWNHIAAFRLIASPSA